MDTQAENAPRFQYNPGDHVTVEDVGQWPGCYVGYEAGIDSESPHVVAYLFADDDEWSVGRFADSEVAAWVDGADDAVDPGDEDLLLQAAFQDRVDEDLSRLWREVGYTADGPVFMKPIPESYFETVQPIDEAFDGDKLQAQCAADYFKYQSDAVADARKRRVYISGPMTGKPGHNFAAFDEAAEKLEAAGFRAENPADKGVLHNDDGTEWTWSQYLKLDIELLVRCDGVLMLDGWGDSEGACLERHIALSLGLFEVSL